MVARYKRWADTHNVAVVLVHHDNKTKIEPGSDPFSRISGTRGLTGAADTLVFLESHRAEKATPTGPSSPAWGLLHVTGRDVDEMTLEMHKSGPLWVVDEPL